MHRASIFEMAKKPSTLQLCTKRPAIYTNVFYLWLVWARVEVTPLSLPQFQWCFRGEWSVLGAVVDTDCCTVSILILMYGDFSYTDSTKNCS